MSVSVSESVSESESHTHWSVTVAYHRYVDMAALSLFCYSCFVGNMSSDKGCSHMPRALYLW